MEQEERTLLSITEHDSFIETIFDGRSQESVDAVIVAFVSILMERKALIRRFLKVLMKALDDPEDYKKIYSTISSPPWVD